MLVCSLTEVNVSLSDAPAVIQHLPLRLLGSSGSLVALTTCQVFKSETCRLILSVRRPARQPARVLQTLAEKAEQHKAAQQKVFRVCSANALSDARMECEDGDTASPSPRGLLQRRVIGGKGRTDRSPRRTSSACPRV